MDQPTASVTVSSSPASVTGPFTLSTSDLDLSNTVITGAIGTTVAPWTYTGTAAPWLSSNPTSGKIQLDGEGADIKVNGWSLVDAVKRIEERLAILNVNPKLENEWEELKALGDQYRKLEAEIEAKMKTWEILNKR